MRHRLWQRDLFHRNAVALGTQIPGMLPAGMLLIGHQDFVTRFHIQPIRDVAVCFRGVAHQRDLIALAAHKRGQRITELVPRRIAPDRIILRIALRHLLRLVVSVEDRPQHGRRRRSHRAIVQVHFIRRDQKLFAQLRPVSLFIGIVQTAVRQLTRSLRELRKKLAAKIHSRPQGGSTRKQRQKSPTIAHLASSRTKAARFYRTIAPYQLLCSYCLPFVRARITVPTAKREDVKMILRARIAAILAIPLTVLASSHSFAQEKTGTKQDVEKRLKAAQKPQAGTPVDNVVKTLFDAHTLQQAAVSPDGNSVAWVEDIHSKNGVISGSTVIYVKNLKAAATLRRIGAGVADSLHAEGSVAWSPDSQKIAFLSDASKKGQLQLYVTNAAGGAAKMLTNVKGFLSTPGWSPDGKQIAFIEGIMSEEGLTGGDIHMIASDGGEPKNLTKDMKASAAWLGWLPDKKILFSDFVGGSSAIATLDPATGKIEQRWSGEGAFSSAGIFGFQLSAAKDGRTIAGIFRSYSHAPEVVLITGESPTPTLVTTRNASLKPAWGEAKNITWKNDGYEVQGWLLYPRDFDPGKKYPMVVDVHGGPSHIALSHWPTSHDFASGLSGMGYFVLCPNPRGSFGQGESFTRANVKDFGYGDFKDIMAGVDEAIRVAPIDPNRLGITGWSYGGFMTMWAVTQTKSFKAAMTGAGS